MAHEIIASVTIHVTPLVARRVVAVRGIVDDWAAYSLLCELDQHFVWHPDVQEIADRGDKLPRAAAEWLFPDIRRPYRP